MNLSEVGVYPEYQISGTHFSPKELVKRIPGLIIRNEHEFSDIVKIGNNKGNTFGYGSCKIMTPENENNSIVWIANLIIQNRKVFHDLKIEDEIIWIYWVGRQGNMEFSKEEMQKLSETELDIAMNYIYLEDELKS